MEFSQWCPCSITVSFKVCQLNFRKTTEESYLIAEVKKVYSNDVLGLNVFKRGSLLNIADVLIKKRMARLAPTDNAQVSYRIPG